jgi:choice-of-anchor C domain-containing protein
VKGGKMKKIGIFLLIISIELCAVWFAPVAYANLLENGSFEFVIDPPTGSYRTLYAINTDITGWTVSSGNIDWVNTYWVASDGNLSLDLCGYVAGKIEQSFSTIAGQKYAVTFDMAGNPVLKGIKELRVEAAGQFADFDFDNTGSTPSNMGWKTNTWIFEAIDSTTTLSFMSLDDYSRSGPTLDNVSVEAIEDWKSAYDSLLESQSDLEVLRNYHDQYLTQTAKGEFYTTLLYNNSGKALAVLLDNPQLMLEANALIQTNIDAVSDVLDGYEGVIYNTHEIAAFLDAYAKKSPPILKILAYIVRWDMLRKQKRGKLFLGFRLK